MAGSVLAGEEGGNAFRPSISRSQSATVRRKSPKGLAKQKSGAKLKLSTAHVCARRLRCFEDAAFNLAKYFSNFKRLNTAFWAVCGFAFSAASLRAITHPSTFCSL